MNQAVFPRIDTAPVERMGPNAITKLAEALSAFEGERICRQVFANSHLETYIEHPPQSMVPEAEVFALHRSLRDAVGNGRARTVSWIAGQRTADYLLAHRIPRAAQTVMRLLPASVSSRILAMMIARNSWTFVGGGQFKARHRNKHGGVTRFTIAGCPLCSDLRSPDPYCDFFAGSFERLFRQLVHADTRVVETECQATGAPACTFSIQWC